MRTPGVSRHDTILVAEDSELRASFLIGSHDGEGEGGIGDHGTQVGPQHPFRIRVVRRLLQEPRHQLRLDGDQILQVLPGA